MLGDLCHYLNNYFNKLPNGTTRPIHEGTFTISGGNIDVPLVDGQYFRIEGSLLNDGVYQYPATDLKDETFVGYVWEMAIIVLKTSPTADAQYDYSAGFNMSRKFSTTHFVTKPHSTSEIAKKAILVFAFMNSPAFDYTCQLTNNAMDSEPVWEDCIPGVIHEFANKTATTPSIAARVRIELKSLDEYDFTLRQAAYIKEVMVAYWK